MVSFIVRLSFNPDDRADVAETLRLLAAASRKEPGCVSYVPHQSEDDPNTVVIYEQYQDQKALAAHRESGTLQETRRGRALPEDAGAERGESACSRLRRAASPSKR